MNLIRGAVVLLIGLAVLVLFKVVALVVLIVLGLAAVLVALRALGWLYHAINPAAKAAYLARKAAADAVAINKKAVEQARADEEAAAVAKVRAAEQARANEEAAAAAKVRAAEQARRDAYRDSEVQTSPYTYQIGRHANEALAIRYGIANQERKTTEYWYFGPGGVKTRNSERDTYFFEPSRTIRIQKIAKLDRDLYEVFLSDFRNRRAKAVIEVGTEYVKTFYPLSDDWFDRNGHLETTLKGNGSFTLKELAEFHVLKGVAS